jgi:hypothetical protein
MKNDGQNEEQTTAVAAPLNEITILSKRVTGFDMDASADLAEREEQGIDVEVEDALGRICYQPNGTAPITINVCGSLSKRYRQVQAIQRGRILKEGRTAKIEDESDEALGQRSLDEQTEAVARCCNSWTPGITSKGKHVPFTLENVMRFLKGNPHMQSKLEKRMTDHARFFGRVSSS